MAMRAEGVAYRDQEISRLEELLSNAQEAARASEQQASYDRDSLVHREQQLEGCARQMDYVHGLAQEREAELCKLKEEASQRELH
ncbi:hypothetical protein LTS01_026104, partial [Friedmanniomyces endolithicus]